MNIQVNNSKGELLAMAVIYPLDKAGNKIKLSETDTLATITDGEGKAVLDFYEPASIGYLEIVIENQVVAKQVYMGEKEVLITVEDRQAVVQTAMITPAVSTASVPTIAATPVILGTATVTACQRYYKTNPSGKCKFCFKEYLKYNWAIVGGLALALVVIIYLIIKSKKA